MLESGEKTFISHHILHQHWYTCPIALPVRRNPQHISSLLTSQPLPHFRFNLFNISERFDTFIDPTVNRFTLQTFPTVNRKYFFMSIHYTGFFCPYKTHNRTLLVDNTFKYLRHFDYWNQPLIMRMCVCYLDCFEAGLCCYLVIHTENLLRPLQLLYFHLWPIYWLSHICRGQYAGWDHTHSLRMFRTCEEAQIRLNINNGLSNWSRGRSDMHILLE
jgi:hypothetical protein